MINNTTILEKININELWDHFNIHYMYPDELNKKEPIRVTFKNHLPRLYPYKGETYLLPEFVEGYIAAKGYFDNMIEGIPGRYGQTPLPDGDYGEPVFIDGYANSNNGMRIEFIPNKADDLKILFINGKMLAAPTNVIEKWEIIKSLFERRKFVENGYLTLKNGDPVDFDDFVHIVLEALPDSWGIDEWRVRKLLEE